MSEYMHYIKFFAKTFMAERVGFEPTRRGLCPAYSISSRAPSTSSAISPHRFTSLQPYYLRLKFKLYSALYSA